MKDPVKNEKIAKHWLINILSALFFLLLAFTGLINWLVLPRGYGAGGGFLLSLRHVLLGVHQWAAAGFIILVLIHAFLHWGYIKANLKASGILKG